MLCCLHRLSRGARQASRVVQKQVRTSYTPGSQGRGGTWGADSGMDTGRARHGDQVGIRNAGTTAGADSGKDPGKRREQSASRHWHRKTLSSPPLVDT